MTKVSYYASEAAETPATTVSHGSSVCEPVRRKRRPIVRSSLHRPPGKLGKAPSFIRAPPSVLVEQRDSIVQGLDLSPRLRNVPTGGLGEHAILPFGVECPAEKSPASHAPAQNERGRCGKHSSHYDPSRHGLPHAQPAENRGTLCLRCSFALRAAPVMRKR